MVSTTCYICFGDFVVRAGDDEQDKIAWRIKCGHLHHKTCLKQWIETRYPQRFGEDTCFVNTCGYCRHMYTMKNGVLEGKRVIFDMRESQIKVDLNNALIRINNLEIEKAVSLNESTGKINSLSKDVLQFRKEVKGLKSTLTRVKSRSSKKSKEIHDLNKILYQQTEEICDLEKELQKQTKQIVNLKNKLKKN